MTWDVIGHDWAVAFLKGHLANGEMRQAYLFSGPPGVGRRTLALRFAQAIACPQPVAPGEPCLTCRTCQQIARQQYADLSIVQPEGDSREIKIDQVRSLQHWLSLAPYESSFRVALLLDFQNAGANAQNSLLKTLEEAPDRAILLLTATSPEELLPTIASRCEIVRLHPCTVADAARHLQSLEGIDESRADILAHLAGGRIGTARHLHASPGEIERWAASVEQLLSFLESSYRQRFLFTEKLPRELPKAREYLQQSFQVWLTVWRDILLCASSTQSPLANLAFETELRRLASRIDLQSARQVVASIESNLKKLDANANPALLAEVTLLDMPKIN